MEPRWTVYCHTHVESGRRYIGLTKLTMMKRWNQHLANARRKLGKGCRHFWNAIRKYGKDAFSHTVLETCPTLDIANKAEDAWISSFSTRFSEFGFNIAPGGLHVPHSISNIWDRPGFRERQMAAVKLAKADPAERARLSRSAKKLWADPGFREKVVSTSKAARSTPESKARASMTQRAMKARPDVKERQREASRQLWQSEEYREKISGRWTDPEYRAKCESGLSRGASLNAGKTRCRNGHEYSHENTYVNLKGSRICRTCARTNGARHARTVRALARDVAAQ